MTRRVALLCAGVVVWLLIVAFIVRARGERWRDEVAGDHAPSHRGCR